MKFEETGAENIADVRESVVEDPNVLIPRCSQELGLLLHLDIHLHPCKVQLPPQLKSAGHSQRHR